MQAWVALPTGMEKIAPSFSHHSGSDLPEWSEAGVNGHLIAGSAYGLTAGAKTHSPLFYAHLDMMPGTTAEVSGGHKERALYIAAGAVEVWTACATVPARFWCSLNRVAYGRQSNRR